METKTNSDRFALPAEELQRQRDYAEMVQTVLASRFAPKKPLAFVHTYGCQGNVADGERIKGILESLGYALTDTQENADLILFNTCAIREHAQDRVFGNVGKLKALKEKNKELIIALCGCMMQQDYVAEKIRKSYPYVNLVFGTHVIYKLPELLYRCLCAGKRVFDLSGGNGNIAEGLPIHRDGAFKAFIPIIYGCNNFCSYCVVPYVRGRERSRSFEAVLEEARELIANGYKELTLLGQNVNSYNKDCDACLRFPALLRAINAIPGDFIIRFMTSHPRDCSEELLLAMAQCEKVARHLHLPVQSGNDRILKEMNRHYTRAHYLSLIERAYELMPDLSITSDVIVGFPGETAEEFDDTLSLVRQAGYTSLFTFIFSPRPGTKAASMPDPTPREEKNRRFQALTDTQAALAAARTAAMKGKAFRVLVEEPGREPGLLAGRTQGNVIIEFPGDSELIGTFQHVRVTEPKTWIVRGELMLNESAIS